mmetsp:Transcript_25620/g.53364  ORF Transcript_25620/g.53364 Transcript_25620/m.53364 type:complete len:111 (-) Transcript_25620:1249-1581(-)
MFAVPRSSRPPCKWTRSSLSAIWRSRYGKEGAPFEDCPTALGFKIISARSTSLKLGTSDTASNLIYKDPDQQKQKWPTWIITHSYFSSEKKLLEAMTREREREQRNYFSP